MVLLQTATAKSCSEILTLLYNVYLKSEKKTLYRQAIIGCTLHQRNKTNQLSNDPGKKRGNFFCYGPICFSHIAMFSFLHRECVNLQKGSLRNNSIHKGRFLCVLRDFNQSYVLKTIAKKSRISVLLRLRRNFVMGTLVRKQGIQKHDALRRFCRTFDVLTNQKCSRDNN